jgi:hypothetical protein
MPNGMRWVGLDVHAHASAVAIDQVELLRLLGSTRRPGGQPRQAGTARTG